MKNHDFSPRYRMFSTGILMILAIAFFPLNPARAQTIYEPEGLNMPGAWNQWNNPPLNNLALASSTQVTGGRVVKIPVGIVRWQTIFSVAETGGDLTGGTYEWLFTSGPSGSPWNNKWSNTAVTMNTLQNYTKEGANNNTITLVNGKWYTMNWEDNDYTNTRAIFMETSAVPTDIATVSVPATVLTGQPATIAITLPATPAAEEIFYIRYTTDGWTTSAAVAVTLSGTAGTAVIPGQATGTVVSYYAFSSTVADVTADYDLYSIKLNTNSGSNYTYTVTAPPPVITFANLGSPATGTIPLGDPFFVFGNALVPGVTGNNTQAPGLEAWFGFSNANTDPSGWTHWFNAVFFGPNAGMDEFTQDLGAYITSVDTFYYATRYRLNGGSYLYGGYSASGGGFWDGTVNVSGSLVVSAYEVPITRNLEDITLVAGQQVCYDAKSLLTVAGNGTYFEVQAGASVNLIAGQQILMLPGTQLDSGGYVHAWISPEGNYCSSLKMAEAIQTGIPAGNHAPMEAIAVSIYPNPAGETITVGQTGIAVPCRLEIYDLRGIRVMEGTIVHPGKVVVPVAGLTPGVYCLRIAGPDGQHTARFVKQ